MKSENKFIRDLSKDKSSAPGYGTRQSNLWLTLCYPSRSSVVNPCSPTNQDQKAVIWVARIVIGTSIFK